MTPREVRKWLGGGQRAFAKLTGIPERTVARIEQGGTPSGSVVAAYRLLLKWLNSETRKHVNLGSSEPNARQRAAEDVRSALER